MNFSLFCFEISSEFILTSAGNFIRGAVSKVNDGFDGVGTAAAERVTEGAAVGRAVATDVCSILGAKVSSIDLR